MSFLTGFINNEPGKEPELKNEPAKTTGNPRKQETEKKDEKTKVMNLRGNHAVIVGVVAADPEISTAVEGEGTTSTLRIYVKTAVGRRDTDPADEYKSKTRYVPVWTIDDELINVMKEWKPGDAVFIYGTVVTKVIKKSPVFCTNEGCNGINYIENKFEMYIHPVNVAYLGSTKISNDNDDLKIKEMIDRMLSVSGGYSPEDRKIMEKACALLEARTLENDTPEKMTDNVGNKEFRNMTEQEKVMARKRALLKQDISEQTENEFLERNRDMSNIVFCFATVLSDPKRCKFKRGLTEFSFLDFMVAVHRMKKIAEDDPNQKSDYPHVKCYGSMADFNEFKIKKGSTIFIDGYFQTRVHKMTMQCACCGKKFEAKVRAHEIVAYYNGIEYIANTRTNEEIKQLKNEQLNNKLSAGLGNIDIY